jgi:hypothetical protein
VLAYACCNRGRIWKKMFVRFCGHSKKYLGKPLDMRTTFRNLKPYHSILYFWWMLKKIWRRQWVALKKLLSDSKTSDSVLFTRLFGSFEISFCFSQKIMGNKLLASPLPSYDSALSQLSSMEISHVKNIFHSLRFRSTQCLDIFYHDVFQPKQRSDHIR